MSIFGYKGKIPTLIKFRAQDVADITGCYVAFDKDGSCWMYPVKPVLLVEEGRWEPSARVDRFQCEEIKFTKRKYKFTDWDTLMIPHGEAIHRKYNDTFEPTRDLDGMISE